MTSANIFHAGYWQRIYSAKTQAALVKASLLSSLLLGVTSLLFGGTGCLAVWSGRSSPSNQLALFELVSLLPKWVGVVIVVLGAAFLASSMDTLLTAITASIAHDFMNQNMLFARGLSCVVLGLATLAAWCWDGDALVTLFLIADLVTCFVAVPVLSGFVFQFVHGVDFIRGVAGSMLSVFVYGCVLDGVAGGLKVFTMPGGLMQSESLYTFLVAIGTSALFLLASAFVRVQVRPKLSNLFSQNYLQFDASLSTGYG